jgi:hypothetical protein
MNLDWLADYSESALGPIQKEEALFLYGFCRAVRPQSVLEFGAAEGHSARVWLEAGVPSVWTMDVLIRPAVHQLAAESAGRLRTIEGDMRGFDPALTGPVDLVFFDAAHDAQANVETFLRLGSVPPWVLIHDTGTWASEHMEPIHHAFSGITLPEGKIHQPAEPIFAAYLERWHGLRRIDFHSMHTLRHGLTLLQRTPLA